MKKRLYKSKQEKLHMSKVAALGCIICGMSLVHLHHIRYAGLGMGRRSSNYEVIPLCQFHHQGSFSVHATPKAFEEKYNLVSSLLKEGCITEYSSLLNGKFLTLESELPSRFAV